LRIFLSFHTKDSALAEGLRAGLLKLDPKADIFFSPISLAHGFWQSKLAESIRSADAFLLLLGPNGVGPWQEVEYHEAFARHVEDKSFALVPVIADRSTASGLPFLRRLNWIVAADIADDKTLHRILAALAGEDSVLVSPLWKLVHPYRGLEAMNEANADYFFGRDTETEAMLRVLSEKPGRLPILIGASGVGKSSVAQAGVLSALKAMRWPGAGGTAREIRPWPEAFRNSRTGWAWITLRPGEDPLAALAAAFTRLWLLDPTDPKRGPLMRQWADGLKKANTLSDLIDATQEQIEAREGAAPARIFLHLDQGEELYTRAHATAPKDAARFSEVLAQGLTDPRVLVIASLRADYFDRLQADVLFSAYEHVNVPPLTRSQLEDVVTGPARALGVGFEDERLPLRIVEAAAAEPGALPLLSYLLTDMWTAMVQRADGVLRLPLRAIDIGGVLASRAEDFLKSRPADEAHLRRLLTLRLALVPTEGEPVRRRALRSECGPEEWALAERLADHPWRLVVTGEREGDGEVMVEVAHEALLRAWPRLQGWLKDEREFLVFKGEVERAERRWRDLGRSDNALLFGLDLVRAEESLKKRSEDLPDRVRAFVQESIAANRAIAKKASRQKAVAFASLAVLGLIATLGGPWAYTAFNKERLIDREAARTDIRGEIVAYAVVAGGRALDTAPGLQTSPYTTPLVAKLHQKDKSLIEAIEDAHEQVISLTAGSQRPFLSTSMNGPIYLWQQPQGRSKRAVVVSVDNPGARWNRLIAPKHDADAVTGVLQEVGFRDEEITRLHNVNRTDIEKALNQACQPLNPPQPSSPGLHRLPANSLVIFYFSGHGFQVDGQNFLMPIIENNPFKTEKEAQLVGLNFDSLQQLISDCSAASVFILDTHFPAIFNPGSLR
jgi:hypothetical protein